MGSPVVKSPREKDPKYLGWVAALPCIACMFHQRYNRECQVAHVRTGSVEHNKRDTGMGEKPSDAWTLPLCMPHHTGDASTGRRAQHGMSELEFWSEMGMDPFAICKALWKAYARGLPGSSVIATYASAGRRMVERTMKEQPQ